LKIIKAKIIINELVSTSKVMYFYCDSASF